jgi:hypothetical protein
MATPTFKTEFSIEENPSIKYHLEYYELGQIYHLTQESNSISEGHFKMNEEGFYVITPNGDYLPDYNLAIILDIDKELKDKALTIKMHNKAEEVFNEFMKNNN